MNKQIDERVVQMQFDNREFESNVKTSMSTIDKLKKSLRFEKSAKGFDELGKAASKVDMSPLSKSIETVQAKFSALEVVGVTALANITNSAVNAGKRLVKSLSIDQVSAGMTKYEQKTASVQTIMNATGKSIDEVNKYLEKLMWFSDETSYGFTDMTQALGTMTAAGGDIEKLIPLITGVANAVAFAGKGASEFGQIMQFGVNQAYSAGYMGLQDWKSFQSRGANSKQLQETFIRIAEDMGKIKKGSVTIQNFATSLKDKWLDTEVMEAGFSVFGDFTEKVYELKTAIEEGSDLSGYSKEVQEWAETVDKSNVLTADVMEILGKEYEGVGEKAFRAGQEAKSFTEAIDATKDAVSSGWMETFELIFGNYEKAKVLWTELCGALWEIFASGGVERNKWLKEVMSFNPLEQLSEKLAKITDAIKAPVEKLQEYEDIVNRIIRGDFGNGQARFDKLTEAGYDWAHAQNLVNEKLGNSFRYATEYKEAQGEILEQTIELTDAKLEEVGLTKEEIKLYRELEKESKKTGKSIGELIEEMEAADGRTLLLGGFKNIGSGILGMIYAIRDAFAEIFPPMTALQAYNLIKAFNELTEKLRLTDKETGELNETGEKLKRTFKGLFAALDIVLTIVGGPIKIAFKALMKILSAFDLDILDVTANVGDAIVAFRDWVDSVLGFDKAFENLAVWLTPVIAKVKEWIGAFKELPAIKNAIDGIKNAFSGDFGSNIFVRALTSIWKVLEVVGKGLKTVYDAFMALPAVQNGLKALGEFFNSAFSGISSGLAGLNLSQFVDDITKFFEAVAKWVSKGKFGENGKELISGLGKAISGGVKAVTDAITTICKAIYNTFTKFFDINSPSKVFWTLGQFLIAGLVGGILASKGDPSNAIGEIGAGIGETIKGIGESIIKIVKDLNFEKVFAVGVAAGLFVTVKKVLGIFEMFGTAAKGFGNMCTQAGNLMKAVTDRIKPTTSKFQNATNGILKLAVAIMALATSVYMLAQLEPAQLWGAVGAIAALAVVIGLLATWMVKLDIRKNKFDIKAITVMFLGLGASLLLMAMAIQKLAFIDSHNLGPILITIAAMIGGLTILMTALGKVAKADQSHTLDQASFTLIKISGALLILGLTLKLISSLDPSGLSKGIACMGLFTTFITILMLATNLAGNNIGGLGNTIFKIAAAMTTLVLVIKLISKLDPDAFNNGVACMFKLAVLVGALLAVTRIYKEGTKGIFGTLMGLSVVMLTLAGIARIVAAIDSDKFVKGYGCIIALSILVIGLVALTQQMKEAVGKGTVTSILAMTFAVGMLAAMAVICGFISLAGLAKGVAAISVLSVMVGLMAAMTKNSKDFKMTVVALTTTIGVMAGAVLALSLIPFPKLAKAVGAMSVLMLSFAAMIYATGKLKVSGWWKALVTIIVMTAVVGALGNLLIAMSKWSDPSALISSAASMGILLGAFAASFAIIGESKIIRKDNLVKAFKTIGVLTLVAGALGFLMIAMTKWGNPEGMIPSAIALSGVLLALSFAMKILGTTGIADFKPMQIVKTITGLAAMIIPLAALAVALNYIPMDNIAGKAKSILALVGVMTALTALYSVLVVVGSLTSITAGIALWGVLGLVAVIGELALLVHLLNVIPMDQIAGKTNEIKTLVGVMTALTALYSVLVVVGAIVSITAGIALWGVLGLVAVIAELAVLAAALNYIPMDKMAGKTKEIETLMSVMTTLTDVLVKVSAFGPLTIMGVSAIKGMVSVLVYVGKLCTLVGAIAGKWAGGFLDKGLLMLEKVATGIGKAIGGFMSGLATRATENLPEIGKNLSEFMEGINGFIEGTKKLDGSAVTNAKTLTEVVGAITQIASSYTAYDKANEVPAMTVFVEKMVEFGEAMIKFSDAIAGKIDNDTVTATATAGKILVEMAKLINDNAGLFSGFNNMTEFGNRIVEFGRAMVMFSDTVKDRVDNDAVESAASAGKIMAALAGEIPNDGGVLGWIMGNNNLHTFGEHVVMFGQALVKFSNETAGKINQNAVDAAKYAGDIMIALAKEIPNTGGVMSWFTGDNSLDDFGDRVVKYGRAMVAFSQTVSSGVDDKAIEAAKNAGLIMTELATKVPAGDNIFTWLTGSDDIADFGERLVSFGKSMTEFSNAVKHDIDLNAISTVITASDMAITMAKNLKDNGMDFSKKTGFASGLTNIGTAMIEFSNQITGKADLEAIAILSTSTKTLADALALMPKEADVGVFTENLGSIGTAIVDFSKALVGNEIDTDNVSKASQAVSDLASSFALIPPTFDGSAFSGGLESLKGSIPGFISAIAEVGVANLDAAAMKVGVFFSMFDDIPTVVDVTTIVDSAGKLGQAICDFYTAFKEASIDDSKWGQYTAMGRELFAMYTDVPVVSDISGITGSVNDLAKAIKDFYEGENAPTIDVNKITLANTAASGVVSIYKDIKTITSANSFIDNIAEMGTNIFKFYNALAPISTNTREAVGKCAGKIIDFYKKVPTDASVQAAVKAMTELVTVVKTFGTLDNATIQGFNNNMSNLGKTGVTEFIDAFKMPNESATNAVNGFVTGISNILYTHMTEDSDFYTSAKDLGMWLVKGFAKGIEDNAYLANFAAGSLAEGTLIEALKRLGIASPSKEFIKIGKFTVLGLARGILKNLATSNEASATMGEGILTAFQDELGIHSPSLVMDEQGHWIVKGVAEGITADMSAEEAAAQKAQNIVDAFQKVFDRNGVYSNINDNELKLWKLTDGMSASESEIVAKEIEYATKNLTYSLQDEKFAFDEWNEMVKYFGETSDEAKQSWDKYRDAQVKVAEDQNEINKMSFKNNSGLTVFEKSITDIERSMETNDANYNKWLSAEGKHASDDKLYEAAMAKLTSEYFQTNDILWLKKQVLESWKNAPKDTYTEAEIAEETYKAQQEVLEWEQKFIDIQNEMSDTADQYEVDELNKIAEARIRADEDLALWLKTDGKYASDAVQDSKKIATYQKNFNSIQAEIANREKKLVDIADKYGESSEEYNAELDNIRNLKSEGADIWEQIQDIYREQTDEQIEAMDLANSNLDIQYQLWEKTIGRNATVAEKNVAKLGILSSQLQNQSSVVQIARSEWQKAEREYGKSSDEAQRKYNEYLSEQLELANLQSEITDINESTVEKQKAAKYDYNDYIKNYEKFYEMNGMTKKQLEEDAKLISGYDPSNTLTKMVNKTNDMFKSLTSSDEYKSMLNGFASMGAACVEAVGQSMDSSHSTIKDSASTMLKEATNVLKDGYDEWVMVGKDLVQGFINGIKSMIPLAVLAAKALGNATSEAARQSFDEHSPSRVFAEIGEFAVLGLVNGLLDNASLAKNAANELSNETIEGLKSTMQAIAEFIDSDIDTQPTIRPVLDLSEVSAGTARLNSMFSRTQAIKAGAGLSKDGSEEIQNGDNNPKVGNSYQFNQYNYSPKPLSRSDIYRQTRNQFTALKGVLG